MRISFLLTVYLFIDNLKFFNLGYSIFKLFNVSENNLTKKSCLQERLRHRLKN